MRSEKAIRDYQFTINSARQEGEEIGEQIGEERGTLIGKMTTFQEILGQSPSAGETLRSVSTEELETMASQLQQTIRSRPAT